MTLNGLFASWSGVTSALGNHSWQSTIFLVAAGLLTMSLRKHPARSRYSLWLAASVKFLIPFSLLITIGSHLSHGSARTNAGFYHAIDAVGQPFPLPLIPEISGANPSTVLPRATPVVPILFAVWLCGFLVVACLWLVRWRRISATVRNAAPLREGREVEALHRFAAIAGLRKRLEILLSSASLEPGIFGIARPVLLWPEGLSERLDQAHLEAILAHELWHVRRRDNLAAAVHMLVEATFWFHPLVWWLGARLVQEREHACDEAVLEMGSERQVYAESILKICEFCVESPLACMSGVAGSDLKKRMVYIMTRSVSRKLDFGRKLLVSAAGFAAVAAPLIFGLVKPTKTRAESQARETLPSVPEFESATIRPNNGEPMAGFTIIGKPFKAIMWKGDRLMATNFTLHGLIRVAYNVHDDQILGGPEWLNTEGYDLDAKMGKSVVDEMQQRGRRYGVSGRTLMLQKLLSDRFKLSFHRETRDLPVYALVVAADGPKLPPGKPGDTYPNGLKKQDGSPLGAGVLLYPEENKLVGQGIPIASLVEDLSNSNLHRTVLDKTGLRDKYDLTLQWTPEESQPALIAAIREQLGLNLEPQTAPVEVLVIDHAERITGDKSSQSEPQDPSLAESVTASMPPPLVYKDVAIQSGKSQASATFTRNFPPEGFNAANVTLESLIEWAYQVDGLQIAGAPDWVRTERYDVQANVDSSTADELRGLSEKQRGTKQQPMILELLADHFKLEAHRETRELPVYELVVAGSGPKLQQTKSGEAPLIRFGKGLIAGHAAPIGPTTNDRPSLVRMLSSSLQRPVLDKTGLEGLYDFSLEWIPSGGQGADQDGPSISAAVQEQLGLKLLQSNGQTAPVQVLVIDHAEKPSED